MSETYKHKSFLKTAFNTMVRKPWQAVKERPLKNGVSEPLYHVFSLYAFPFGSWDRAFKALALYFAFYPMASIMLPTGAEFLESQRLDPAAAEEVSDVSVRVMRHENRRDRIYNQFSMPTIFGSFMIYDENNSRIAASSRMLWRKIWGTWGTCPIMVPRPDIRAKEYVEVFASTIPRELVENTGVSQRVWYLYIALHEFAHCHTQNPSHNLGEGDADWRSILKVS